MIDAGQVMIKAHAAYRDLKLQQGLQPKDIPSAQIQALCETLVAAFNEELLQYSQQVDARLQELHRIAIAAYNS